MAEPEAELQYNLADAFLRGTRNVAALAPASFAPCSLSRKPERRQLTLLFCDLADSVGLSLRLDPEDLRDVISTYQAACVGPISRYSGHVARYVGDGILVFFGYPAAHEDDAERAVRAGLEIIASVMKLNETIEGLGDLNLRVRIGIATGLVVVGDMTAGGAAEKDAVSGEAANLAARLQTVAAPNTVAVSSLTRQLAAEQFVYRELGAQTLKGFDRPVLVYEVVAERGVSRLEARSMALTPFVGRGEEIELLIQLWQRASAGSGQVAVLSGEAGIGKSRIVAEACTRIRDSQRGEGFESSSGLLFQCSPFHGNAALFPVIRQLEQQAKIGRFDADEEKLEKLAVVLKDCQAEHALALIADLIGVDASKRCAPVVIGPTAKKHSTIEALTEWCVSLTRDGAVIIVFEDVHWIDPTSTLLLKRLATVAADHHLLLIVTARADTTNSDHIARLVVASGPSPPHITIRRVGELPEAEVRCLMTLAADHTAISPLEMDAVLRRSEGNPLYVEELVKGILRAGELSSKGDRSAAPVVPNSLSDALMAQLDQLGPAKEIAQYGSVIGQEFSLPLLAKVASKPFSALRDDLSRLVDARIVVRSPTGADVYMFKHALLRDLSYESLLKKSRRDVHLKIAEALAGRTTEAERATDDLIAQHFSRGEAHPEAIRYWLQGAREAIARSAHEEALGMLKFALQDFPKARGEGPVSELDLVLAQTIALRSIRGYSAPEVEDRLLHARQLCTLQADSSNRFSVEWALFQCTIVKGDVLGAANIAPGLFEYARRHPEQPFVDAHLASGMAAFHLGHLEEARAWFEEGVKLSNPETDEPHFFTHGQNPGLFCLSYLSRTECFLGDVDRARATVERGLVIAERRARDPGHIYSYVNALTFAVRVFQLCGDTDSERRFADEIVAVSRLNHYAYYEALGVCHRGWVMGAAGALSEGISELVAGIRAVCATGTSLAVPGFYLLLSQLYIRAKLFDEADSALERAINSVSFGTRVWDAEIERARGDILALQPTPDVDAAESAYRLSLTIARRQGARALALKAAVSLARLPQRRTGVQECHALLQASLLALPAGSNTEDVRTARALIRELAETSRLTEAYTVS